MQSQWARTVGCDGPLRYMAQPATRRFKIRPDTMRKRLKTVGAKDPPRMDRKRGCKSKVAPPHMMRDLPLCHSGDTVAVEMISTLLDTELAALEMPFRIVKRAGFRKGLRLH